MQPTAAEVMLAAVNASPLLETYGTELDRESAYELLSIKMNAAADAEAVAETAKVQSAEDKKLAAQYEQEWKNAQRKSAPPERATTRTTTRRAPNPIADALGSRTGQTIVREVLRGVFSTLKRR